MTHRLLAIVTALLFATSLVAASPATHYLRALDADQLLRTADYDGAVSILDELVLESPENGRLWVSLGRARSALGRHREAASAFAAAMQIGELSRADGALMLAREHARLGEAAKALDWLEESIDSGYRFRGSLLSEPAFDSLRGFPRFLSLAAGVHLGTAPERNDGWRIDLDFLLSELKRVHYRLRREPWPESFTRDANELREAIPELPDSRIVVELQSLLASLDDGHTLIYPFGMERGMLPRLPLGLWLFSDGLFVLDAPDGLKDLVGTRIVAVDDTPVEEVLAGLRDRASVDNDSGFSWVAPVYLTFVDYLAASGATAAGAVTFTVSSKAEGNRKRRIAPAEGPIDPSTVLLRLPPPPAVEAPLYLKRTAEAHWSTVLDEGKVVYAQCNAISDSPDATLDAFAAALRRQLGLDSVHALVLDLRHNAGGDAGLLPELVRTLIHFETSRDGKIYVLMGRNTFSAGQTLLNLLEQFTGAVFVGEPSGSRPNRLGNEAPFRLPFSGVIGSISSGYNQASTSRDERAWIAPDVPVRLTSSDYFAGRDAGLAAILELIRSDA